MSDQPLLLELTPIPKDITVTKKHIEIEIHRYERLVLAFMPDGRPSIGYKWHSLGDWRYKHLDLNDYKPYGAPTRLTQAARRLYDYAQTTGFLKPDVTFESVTTGLKERSL